MYAPPMARRLQRTGLGAQLTRLMLARRAGPLQPTSTNTDPGWERGWVGWGLLKQGQAVAISGWYSSCWPVIHTHSNPRLIIECPHNTSFKYPPQLKLKYRFISPKRNCFCWSIILIYVVMQSARMFLLTTWSRSCSYKIYAVAVNHPG